MSSRYIVRVTRLLALAASLALVLPGFASELKVRATDGWIREAPPVSTMLAGYLTIENESAKAIAIVGATSPVFARIEIHRTEIEGGVARMRRQERVVVPPGGTQPFGPGGYHLMLMKPDRPLKAGDVVGLALSLEDGQSIQAELLVMKGDPE